MEFHSHQFNIPHSIFLLRGMKCNKRDMIPFHARKECPLKKSDGTVMVILVSVEVIREKEEFHIYARDTSI